MRPQTQKIAQKIDWSALFFSAQGRVSQAPFLIAATTVLLVSALYESAVKGALQFMTGWVIYPVLFYCGACVLSKRLHDRGRSGWWSAVILIGLIMIWPSPKGWFDVLGILVLIWAAVDLSFMPGERGRNTHGPNPAASALPEDAA